MKQDAHRRAQTKRGRTKASAPRASSPERPAASATASAGPLLTEADMRRAILELANTLAPADVGDLLAEEDAIRKRAGDLDGARGDLLRTQLELALACVHDHAAGACPQIPYFTISLLTAGLAYLVDELDIIPDFLPKIGTLDDALVMAMACRLAEDGLRRYCTWKGLDPVPALGVPAAARRRRAGTAAHAPQGKTA